MSNKVSSEQIKLLCVHVKHSDSPEKVKSKILKGLRNAEKKPASPVLVSQPLQVWSKELHSISDLPAEDVVKVLSNSRYIVFLLKDGSVCRIKCSSKSKQTTNQSMLDVIRSSNPTFQELSDAEYARQLQTEMDSGGEGFNVVEPRPPVIPPLRSSSLEELNQAAHSLMYLGTLYERNPEYYNSLSPPRFGFPSSSSHGATPGPSIGRRTSVRKEKRLWPSMGTLEWATEEGNNPIKFVAMAALHSEILLVDSEKRQLYSWKCDGGGFPPTPHSLTDSLGLSGERITIIESGELRASLLTESGKVATFYDPLLRAVPKKGSPPLVSSLSHEARMFPEFDGDPVTSLSLSNFITVATTASGRALWWGLCPQPPNTKSRTHSESSRGTITDGCLVKLKDGAPCGPNTVVYCQSSTGTPLVGRTMNSIEQAGLSSKLSVLVKVYKQTSLEGQSSTTDSPLLRDIESSTHFDNLDVWKLSDVVFLDDSPAVLGRVVTVDQHQAIVDVSSCESATTSVAAKSSLKVFKTSDLELCMNPLPSVNPSPSDQATSQHIAGIVQHKPICVCSPCELESSDEESKTRPGIHGCKPLTVHTTNSGPTLLVERVSDKQTFLVCSGQTSNGPFVTSSFVALGHGKNSKPRRSTISEESVSSTEGGFVVETGHQTPVEFVCYHNSQVLLLKDVNGQICPLMDGLKLQPTADLPSRQHCSSQPNLMAAYNCVLSRSYNVSKEQTALVVVLVPRSKHVIPHVISGDVTRVQTILSSLGDKRNKRKCDSEVHPPSKKLKLDVVAIEMSSHSAIDEQVVEKPFDRDFPSGVRDFPLGVKVFTECTIHNCNVLHVCCQLSGSAAADHVPMDPNNPESSEGCLCERRKGILDKLLQCQHIRPTIIKLLCSKNAFGQTPFLHAVDNQNYSCALLILQFVTSLSDKAITDKSLLSCSPSGTTPLTQLFASLSATFDTTSCRLLVANMPSGYLAQALLQLFQVRYPSVYKAVISRRKGEGTSDSESCSESSGDEDSGEVLTFATRSRARAHRHRPYVRMGLSSRHTRSSSPLRGVVYFSDIHQLRAAAKEMHDYKLTTNLSPSTGFGQAHSIHHLSVSVSVDDHQNSDESVVPGNMELSSKRRAHPGRPRGGELLCGNKFSHPSLAHSLLVSLLTLEGVATATDEALETTLSSVIHNTKCLEALQEIQQGQRSQQELSGELVSPTPTASRDRQMLREFTNLADLIHSEHAYSGDTERLADVPGPSSRTTPLPVMPYASLAEYLGSFSTQLDLSQVVRDFETPITLVDNPTPTVDSSNSPPLTTATREVPTAITPNKPLTPSVKTSSKPLLSKSPVSKTKTICSCSYKDGLTDCGVNLLSCLASSWPCLVTTLLGFYPIKDHLSLCNYTYCSVQSVDSFTSNLMLNCDTDTVNVVVATIVNKMNEAMSLVSSDKLSLLIDDIDWFKVQRSKVTEENVALLVGRRFVESLVRVLAMKHSKAGNTLMDPLHNRQTNGGRQTNTEWGDSPQTSLGNGGQRSEPTTSTSSTKDISKVVESVLSQFSWISVSSLVRAAEASIAPVRLGVAKPLGASSVIPEYQLGGGYGYDPTTNYPRRPNVAGREAPQNSISRQVHTRTALPRATNERKSPFQPPSEGVVLRPMSSDSVSGGGVSGESVSGEGVTHDDSFDDMDLSDLDDTVGPSSRPHPRTIDPLETVMFDVNRHTIDVSNYFMDLDTDQSDEEDYPPPGAIYNTTLLDGDAPGQQGDNEEDRLGDIYPYAWALDGRRIGETNTQGNQRTANISMVGASVDASVPLASIPSIRFGSGFLARTFARLVKDMVDIVKQLDEEATQPCLSLPPSVSKTLVQRTVDTLERTWAWIVTVLDVAEGQLQRGHRFDTERHVMSLRTGGGRPEGNGRRTGRTSRSFVGSSPSEYIAYLLRSHDHEDNQSLPVLDLYGYEHVVYCLDGLLYTLSHIPKDTLLSVLSQSASNLSQTTTRDESFFVRTESVIVSDNVQRSNYRFFGEGSLERDPQCPWTTPLVQAYPLAKQPHLLQPYTQRENLFGGAGDDEGGAPLPVTYVHDVADPSADSITTTWSAELVHKRWHLAISVFAHIFLAEGPGGERSNFLNSRAGFASRMARFRHQVTQLYGAFQMSRDWSRSVSSTFSIRVRRDNLLQDSLDMLLTMTRFHYSSIRVKFEGEDGSGPGVNRGFFASLANDLMSTDLSKAPTNKLGRLFYQPGKLPEQMGMYSPYPFAAPLSTVQTKVASIKTQRRSAFLSIGRFLGLCLWFRYTIPLTLCRHVAKFLLGRDIAWHDLAFYNADLHEGMRRMIVDTEQDKKDSEEFLATYCCYFEAPLTGQFSEPVLIDLIPGGSKIPVTPARVQEYVRLYAMFTMVGCVQEELQAMKEGINDIVPPELLSSLTAEDFQLLLSGGSMDISVARLKSVIMFNHTHIGSAQFRQKYERLFWRVVKYMTNTQRQQFLYFATGSAALPASSDSTNRDASIAITIDVIRSSDVDSLPVASTCSQRMSLPLYPTYSVLKKKLLQAIQCQAYGLG